MKKFILLLLAYLVSTHTLLVAQENNFAWITGNSGDVSISPVFSPDGNFISFSKASFLGIYVYDIINKSTTQLTDEPGAGFASRWSSDSKSILARVARYTGMRRYNSVKIFDVQTGRSIQLSEESLNMPYLPEWVPGNDKILIPQQEGVELIETGIEPFYIENEKQIIVYSKYDKIVLMDLTTSKESFLEPVHSKEYLNVTLSPDRSKIAFEVYGENMYAINIDGSGLVDLGIGYNPKWTGDSRQIVYMITEDDGHSFIASDIYIINADGTGKRNLTNTEDVIELNPSISPDGKKLVYESYLDGAIYLMKLD